MENIKPAKKFPFLVSWNTARKWSRPNQISYVGMWLTAIGVVLAAIFGLWSIFSYFYPHRQSSELASQQVDKAQPDSLSREELYSIGEFKELTGKSFQEFEADEKQIRVEAAELLAQGTREFELENFTSAFICFEQSAKKGNVEAQYRSALRCLDGKGTKQDYHEAVKWLKKAAEKEHAYAQYSLALRYFLGQGVEQNYYKAVELFEKSAQQDIAEAQYRLALRYLDGKGLNKKSYHMAVEWLKKAANQGHGNAQYNLALRYFLGQGVEQNYYKAVEWLQKAAAQGLTEAQEKLDSILTA